MKHMTIILLIIHCPYVTIEQYFGDIFQVFPNINLLYQYNSIQQCCQDCRAVLAIGNITLCK